MSPNSYLSIGNSIINLAYYLDGLFKRQLSIEFSSANKIFGIILFFIFGLDGRKFDRKLIL